VFMASPTEAGSRTHGKESTCIFDKMMRHSKVRGTHAAKETRSVTYVRKDWSFWSHRRSDKAADKSRTR
jgi:hypothetical protein